MKKIPDPRKVKIAVGEVIASPIEITVGPDLKCPRCGALEVEDTSVAIDKWVWNIRPNKVCDDDGTWWSECLRCKKGGRESWFCY
jgi:hypothetical protein